MCCEGVGICQGTATTATPSVLYSKSVQEHTSSLYAGMTPQLCVMAPFLHLTAFFCCICVHATHPHTLLTHTPPHTTPR
jgi:hypothetical protein